MAINAIPLKSRMTRLPPIACFVVARRTIGGGSVAALTYEEIAERSGLPYDKVVSISWLTSWDSVTCGDMHRFTKGCGVDFGKGKNVKAHYRFLMWSGGKRRLGHFPHLRKLPNYPEYRARLLMLKSLANA